MGQSASTFLLPSWSSVSASLIFPSNSSKVGSISLNQSVIPISRYAKGVTYSQPSGGGFLFCLRTLGIFNLLNVSEIANWVCIVKFTLVPANNWPLASTIDLVDFSSEVAPEVLSRPNMASAPLEPQRSHFPAGTAHKWQ